VRNRGARALAATALVALSLCACSNPSLKPAGGSRILEPSGWKRHNLGVTREAWEMSYAWGEQQSMHMAGVSQMTDVGGGLHGAVGSLLLSDDSSSTGYLVEPGVRYTVETPVKILRCPDSGPGVWAELFFFTVSGAPLKQVNGPSLNKPCKPGERTIAVAATAPKGAVYVQPTVVMGTRHANDDMEFYAAAATLTARR
jgi:hypothetical protein